MAQSFLGPNPGSIVRDTQAISLLAMSGASSTQTGSWVASGRPEHVAFELALGAITGTSVVCDVEVQGADDASGTNLVSYGHFDAVNENSGNQVRVLEGVVYKPYIRAVATISGTTPSVTGTLKVVLPVTDRAIGRTA